MTDSTRAALEGFSEVWARVRGEGGAAEGSGSELEVLREFIADESCAAAFYEAAARRFAKLEGADMVQVSVTRTRPAGPYHLMDAQNPVWLFSGEGRA